eukprot:jgi/Chlat1/5031/Chrsp32S00381
MVQLLTSSTSSPLSYTLAQLLALRGERTLEECFQLFGEIHRVTTDHASVARITKEALTDFERDNVCYVELRTTPKEVAAEDMTKRSYTEAVLDAIDEYRAAGGATQVRLLLSIDRRETAAAAADTVRLAHDLKSRGVVGIDLSGNPRIGDWATFEPALRWAQDHRLAITLHCAEVYNPEETRAMLALRPDRVGHVCALDDTLTAQLLASGIPAELCLTSNVRTESVPSYHEHHFNALRRAGHPICLCTDDAGVFDTTLSREYALTAAAFNLTPEHLRSIAAKSIDYAFLDEASRAKHHCFGMDTGIQVILLSADVSLRLLTA